MLVRALPAVPVPSVKNKPADPADVGAPLQVDALTGRVPLLAQRGSAPVVRRTASSTIRAHRGASMPDETRVMPLAGGGDPRVAGHNGGIAGDRGDRAAAL